MGFRSHLFGPSLLQNSFRVVRTKDLADQLGKDASNIRRAIYQLEEAGFLRSLDKQGEFEILIGHGRPMIPKRVPMHDSEEMPIPDRACTHDSNQAAETQKNEQAPLLSNIQIFEIEFDNIQIQLDQFDQIDGDLESFERTKAEKRQRLAMGIVKHFEERGRPFPDTEAYIPDMVAAMLDDGRLKFDDWQTFCKFGISKDRLSAYLQTCLRDRLGELTLSEYRQAAKERFHKSARMPTKPPREPTGVLAACFEKGATGPPKPKLIGWQGRQALREKLKRFFESDQAELGENGVKVSAVLANGFVGQSDMFAGEEKSSMVWLVELVNFRLVCGDAVVVCGCTVIPDGANRSLSVEEGRRVAGAHIVAQGDHRILL